MRDYNGEDEELSVLKHIDELKSYLSILDEITNRLDKLSGMIAVGSIVHMIFAAFSLSWISGAIYVPAAPFSRSGIVLFIDGSIFLCLTYLLYYYERIGKSGNLIFQELSDGLEFESRDLRFGIGSRITMKRFVQSTGLPFVASHRSGPANYFVFNFFISVACWGSAITIRS